MTAETIQRRWLSTKKLIAGAALGIACWVLLSTDVEAAPHMGEPIDLHLPTIPPIESMPLTAEGVDRQLALIQKAQDAVQAYHDKFAYLVEPHDPDLVKLEKAIAFYDAQHDKLLEMRPAILQQESASMRPEYSEYHKNIRAGRIRDSLSQIVDQKEFKNVTASLYAIDALVDKARPGTILYTDVDGTFGKKGTRFWYPLEGTPDPEKKGSYILPPLIEFKYDGASELPLSTSRALYDLQLTLKDRMTLDTPLGDVEDAKSKTYVTAGSADSYKGHTRFGGHSDLSAIDFRAVDTSPAGVAEVLADAARARDGHPHGHLWFEIPGSKLNPSDVARLTAFQESAVRELAKHGYSEDKAWEFIKSHTRLVPGANAMHYHFDTLPRPPILAPQTLVAQG